MEKGKKSLTQTNVRETALASAKWAGIGALIGIGIGACVSFDRIRKQSVLRESLTTNPDLEIDHVYADAGACNAFAALVSFRHFDPVAYDTALFNGNEILRWREDVSRRIRDPTQVVEDVPPRVNAILVQLKQALLRLKHSFAENYGFMITQYDDAAAAVMKRFSDVSYNVAAEVRNRKRRPVGSPPPTPTQKK